MPLSWLLAERDAQQVGSGTQPAPPPPLATPLPNLIELVHFSRPLSTPALTPCGLFECQAGYESKLCHLHNFRSNAVQRSPVCHTHSQPPCRPVSRRTAHSPASQPQPTTTHKPHGLTRACLFLRSCFAQASPGTPRSSSPPVQVLSSALLCLLSPLLGASRQRMTCA